MGILDRAKGTFEAHKGDLEQHLNKAKDLVNKHAGGVPVENPEDPADENSETEAVAPVAAAPAEEQAPGEAVQPPE